MIRQILAICAICAIPAAAQLTADGNQFITLASPGVPGAPSEDDTLGRAVTTGDFDGDGFKDLAISVPGDIFAGPSPNIPGKVVVLYGAVGGFDPLRGQKLGQEVCNGQANCLKLMGDAVNNEVFGYALASGDFNGDTYDDLAIGVPWANSAAGEVTVAYGSASGLTEANSQLWSQANEDLTGQAEASDLFGLALTACDFNGDGRDDLAVGITGENVNVQNADVNDAGAFMVLYGADNLGLTPINHQFWNQSNNVNGTAEVGSILGAALTCGDFNGDGFADLGVSAPRATVDGVNQAGRVHEIRGSAGVGLDSNTQAAWDRDSPGAFNQLGFALSAGDFNGDGFSDIVFGMPFENIGVVADAGGMDILFGTGAGLVDSGSQNLSEGVEPVASISNGPQTDDLIGYGVTAGDFNQDGFDDLVQSIPGQLVNGMANAGAFRVLPGRALMTSLAPRGGATTDNFQFFTQDTPGIVEQAEVGDQIGLPWPNEPRAGASFFGNPAATGDFNGDGFEDLALGVPLEDLVDPDTGPIPNAGGVHVIFGSRQPPADLQQKINDLRNAVLGLEAALP